jgi:short-subunit dehydrogenase
MRELSGRTALITGATGGLGRHLAWALAGEGMSLVLSARDPGRLEGLRDELRGRGTTAEIVAADLGNRDELDTLIAAAEAALAPVDVLVNNAGIEVTRRFLDITDEEVDGIVGLNIVAPMLLTKAALPGMLRRGRGHVVNVASIAGKVGVSCNAHYSATKAALIGLTRSLRAEFRDAPVGFSVVCPGFIADDGMFARMQREDGIRTGLLTRAVAPERVAAKTVKAIRDDLPDVTINGTPIGPALALSAAAPQAAELITERSGANEIFETVADHRASS